METVTAKERILKSIREAMTNNPVENPYPSIDLDESVAVREVGFSDTIFAENFVRRGGKLVYCEDVETAVQSLHLLGHQADWSYNIYCGEETIGCLLESAGLVYSNHKEDVVIKRIGCCSCAYLLSQTGSIAFDASAVGRRLYASVDIMIFFATIEQIVPNWGMALRSLKEEKYRPSSVTVWTGLSQMTDIDGEVRSGLGPSKVILFLIDQKEEV